jgi:hypothetical protein
MRAQEGSQGRGPGQRSKKGFTTRRTQSLRSYSFLKELRRTFRGSNHAAVTSSQTQHLKQGFHKEEREQMKPWVNAD